MPSLESRAIWREIRARQDLLRSQRGGCPASSVFAEAVDQVIEDMAQQDATPSQYTDILESRHDASAA